ncbi:MAG: hypothetical protein ACK5F4_06660 [Ignavibacteria bacterium]|jgi:hypothetical protein
MIRQSLFALFFISSLCGLSCSNHQSSNDAISMVRTNLCGGADRSNNFMSVAERFTAETAIFEQFPVSDSLGLSSIMAIDEVNVAFATESGFVGVGNSSLVKWTLKVSTGKGYVASGMCRDTAGNVYCVSTTGYMIKISPDGIMQWRKRLLSDHAGPIIWLDLLSVKDGIVACGDTSLFKVDFAGNVMWRQDRGSTPVRTISADMNGNLYASHSMREIGGTDTLLCYNPEGRVRWKAVLPFVRLTTQPLVHKDRIFVGGQRMDNGRKTPALFCFKDEGTKCWEKVLTETPRFLSSDEASLYIVSSEPRIAEKARTLVMGYTHDGIKRWHVYVSAQAVAPLLVSKSNIGLLAKHEQSAADFFLFDKEGVLESQFSFAEKGNSDQADFLPIPTVLNGSTIALPCKNKSGVVAVQEKRGLLF